MIKALQLEGKKPNLYWVEKTRKKNLSRREIHAVSRDQPQQVKRVVRQTHVNGVVAGKIVVDVVCAAYGSFLVTDTNNNGNRHTRANNELLSK